MAVETSAGARSQGALGLRAGRYKTWPRATLQPGYFPLQAGTPVEIRGGPGGAAPTRPQQVGRNVWSGAGLRAGGEGTHGQVLAIRKAVGSRGPDPPERSRPVTSHCAQTHPRKSAVRGCWERLKHRVTGLERLDRLLAGRGRAVRRWLPEGRRRRSAGREPAPGHPPAAGPAGGRGACTQ